MIKAYIYEIKNKKDHKVYYGSTIDIKRRFSAHLYLLKNNKHHNLHLQRAWNRDGEHNFIFSILEEFYVDEMHKKQQILLKEQTYLDRQPEYNICKKAGSLLGSHWKVKDEKRKSYIRRGERNNNSRLTWEHVKNIRKLAKEQKVTGYKLAKIYNVSYSLIYQILNNKKWIENDEVFNSPSNRV